MNTFSVSRILGTVAKYAILALVNALFGYMAYIAFLGSEWMIGAVLCAILVALDYVYLNPRVVAGKFLVPGTILLVIFVIAPIVYTVVMSGYNYRTGNEVTKDEAIAGIIENGWTADEAGTAYDMVLGNKDGQLAALLTEQTTQEVFLGLGTTVTKLEVGSYEVNEYGVAQSTQGFKALTPDEAGEQSAQVEALSYLLPDGSSIRPDSIESASRVVQIYEFSADKNSFTDTSMGIKYVDNGNGNFVQSDDRQVEIYPGWRALNPLLNYGALLTNPAISKPFVSVFIWTITFAILTVFIMFSVGLLLALALDKKIAFRNVYRAILILPYAIPSFMSILIWGGLFNRQFGAINEVIGVQIDWIGDPILAKVVILVVNLWLGFPYFYMISSGALQAFPAELEEAAEIDGASGRQVLFQIKLPLLMQILSPLLIASFAFNFNNFNIVYLLTGGGPTNVLEGETAGATDILITYAYKTAFGQTEQNLGLASAISVIMFVIVGALSIWSLRRSKVLESL